MGWGWALAIDPTADETSSATPGVPGEPGFFDAAAANALAPDTVDLSHVTDDAQLVEANGGQCSHYWLACARSND